MKDRSEEGIIEEIFCFLKGAAFIAPLSSV